MANVKHSSLTGTDLHEPKGIATANADEIYVADGLGSGSWTDIADPSGAMVITNNSTGTSLTAAIDTTLGTNTDYVKLTGFSAGLLDNVTFSNNELTVGVSGKYYVNMYANLSVNVVNTTIAFKFAVNDVIALQRRPKVFSSTTGVFRNVSGSGLVEFTAGDKVQIYWASDKTATVTIEDMVFLIHRVG